MFTKDCFICGLCGQKQYSIDEYVIHMLHDENCILLLQASSVVKDLLLPRFKSNIKNNDVLIDTSLPASLLQREIPEQLSLDKRNSIKKLNTGNTGDHLAVEVETGNGTRWKCKLCFLTFSRQAAHLNHFRLQHEMKQEVVDAYEGISSDVKLEPSDCSINIGEKCTNSSTNIDQTKNLEVNLNIVKKSDSPPTCQICGQIFKTERILSCHLGVVHSEKRPFPCEINSCNISFKTKGSLMRHQRRHTGERPFECSNCGRRYRESGSLLRHKQSRISCARKSENQLGRYGITLPFTNVNSDTKIDCKIKMKEEPMSCLNIDNKSQSTLSTNCNEESKAAVRLQILSSKTQELSSICIPQHSDNIPQEKKHLLNIKDLKKELIYLEDQNKKSEYVMSPPPIRILKCDFTCPVCYKVYKKESSLSNHMKDHLDELQKNCLTCNKKFSSDCSLARHLICHSTTRQFECNICGKSFKLKSHAVSHVNSHLDKKAILCSECGRHFKSVSSRNNHIKIHIGERNYECAVCYKKFLVKASLDRHLRIHSQEKPFQCSHCQRRFREHGTLSRHIKNKQLCSQLNRLEKEEVQLHEDVQSITLKNILSEDLSETLSEINDTMSENESELESYLSEKVDLSSMYSDPSEIPLAPEEYLIPAHFAHLQPFGNDNVTL